MKNKNEILEKSKYITDFMTHMLEQAEELVRLCQETENPYLVQSSIVMVAALRGVMATVLFVGEWIKVYAQ